MRKYLYTMMLILFCVTVQAHTVEEYTKAADAAVKTKNYDKALELLKKANKPSTPDVLDRIATVQHLKKDYVEEVRALELLKLAGKMSPNQLSRLGVAYTETNKTPEAVAAFREAIKNAPKYDRAYEGLYNLYIKVNRNDDARLVIMEVLEKLGPQKEWLDEYCRIEFEQKFFEDTKDICQKAIMQDPKNADNHVYLALAYKATDNAEQARKILFKAAKQFQNSEFTQTNAGLLSEEIQNWEQAQEQFTQCIRVNREAGTCYFHLGKVLFELKKYEKSLKALIKSCPYEKTAEVEMRRYSFELEKSKHPVESKMFSKEIDKCDLVWFQNSKKPKK